MKLQNLANQLREEIDRVISEENPGLLERVNAARASRGADLSEEDKALLYETITRVTELLAKEMGAIEVGE